jgi:chorismate mutase/prephenate dehydratase
VVQGLREKISEVDRALLATINMRLELVAQLKRHKEEVGLPFVDPDRERALIDGLVGKNGGPLTEDGLRELYAYLLALTKREVSRG